uniref:Integrase p58-like C-terminal domain-containing protein n=2 Tax=Lygus hesperus TaxID=30085 RepID=A0A146LKK5_LYGHE
MGNSGTSGVSSIPRHSAQKHGLHPKFPYVRARTPIAKHMRMATAWCKKFWSPWTGPWKIISKSSEVTYEVVDKLGQRRQVVHINRLKPAMVQGVPDDALVEDIEPPITPENTPERVMAQDDPVMNPNLEEEWSSEEEDDIGPAKDQSGPEPTQAGTVECGREIETPTPPYSLRPRPPRNYMMLHKKGRMARVGIEHWED